MPVVNIDGKKITVEKKKSIKPQKVITPAKEPEEKKVVEKVPEVIKPKIVEFDLPELIQISNYITVKELAEKLNLKLKYIEEKMRFLKMELMMIIMVMSMIVMDIIFLMVIITY